MVREESLKMATFVKSIEKEQAQQEECLALPLAI